MNKQEFSIREALSRSIDGWWIMILFAVVGGAVGWAFHFLLPPVYEAAATMTVSMEFTPRPSDPPMSNEELTLTTYEEDFAFNSAEFIINSVAVRSQVMEAAKAEGLAVTTAQLQHELTLERRQSNWSLIVRDRDPQAAAELANQWAEKSLTALNATLEHSIKADVLTNQIADLTKALDTTPPGPTYDQYQATLANYTNELVVEKKASSGLLPSMSFTLNDEAASSGRLVLYNLGLLVFAGAAIGFLISLWWVHHDQIRRRG